MKNEINEEIYKKVRDFREMLTELDRKRDENLTVPKGIRAFYDISYGPHGKDNLLDVYMKNDVNEKQPTIVNIHGGAWIYGSKDIYKFYCMSLALRGFTVVNINYRLAPENLFPSPLEDINLAMNYIEENADKYFIDTSNMILVGDSAGAQLVSHYVTIFTNPNYARLFGYELPDVKIKALGLNCGLYDTKLVFQQKLDERFLYYVGESPEDSGDSLLEKIDVMSNITKDFPPAYIVSSHADFLLPFAEPLFNLLKEKGVETEMKIYGSPDRPDIAHVFHVNMNLTEAKICNDEECQFFKKYVK